MGGHLILTVCGTSLQATDAFFWNMPHKPEKVHIPVCKGGCFRG